MKRIKSLLREVKNNIRGHHKRRTWVHKLFGAREQTQGFTKYSVVTAVYNAAPYLDDYFYSLTTQRLNFQNNIQLILVNDGSTDNTESVIKKWQKKFPDNIVYLYQDNQGANFARNAGLSFVKNPWVTFIDSDDFVHTQLFLACGSAVAGSRSF